MAEVENVTLMSSDDETFKVPKEVVEESQTVKHILADTADDTVVPLPNVNAKILTKVIEFCKFSVESRKKPDDDKSGKSPDEIKAFNKKFVDVDKSTLFELILAANYLNIKDMLDITCQAVADMIKGKSPEEIRKEFNIENDFTPEEEEEIRRENQWAFD